MKELSPDEKQLRIFEARKLAIVTEMTAINDDADHWNRVNLTEDPIVIEPIDTSALDRAIDVLRKRVAATKPKS